MVFLIYGIAAVLALVLLYFFHADWYWHVLSVALAFLMLGACPPGADPATAPNNHATDAIFDDSVLPAGAALYAELALQRLLAAPTPPAPRP